MAAQVSRWPALRLLNAQNSPGPSDALGRALAAALPSMPDAAYYFYLGRSGMSEAVKEELRAAKAAAGSGASLYL